MLREKALDKLIFSKSITLIFMVSNANESMYAKKYFQKLYNSIRHRFNVFVTYKYISINNMSTEITHLWNDTDL